MKKYITTALIAGAVSAATVQAQTNTTKLIGLKDAFAGKFLIGAAADVPGGFSPAELANIKANYDIITPENCMKPQSVHPTEDRFTWNRADALVQWCRQNDIKVWGHTLAWHAQSGGWFWGASTNPAVSTREASLARLKNHIAAEVGRYKGKIYGWDVVNEAIDDRGNGDPEQIRRDAWDAAIGPDYIALAFKWAHEADANALLFYNDYNIEQGATRGSGKHAASMTLLKRLLQDGTPINGVGIQGHWSLDTQLEGIDQAISDYESLGLKVAISELDVAVTGNNSGAFQVDAGGPATADAFQRQADFYKKLFEIFNKHAKSIVRVTFWGVDDHRSWRARQSPLVFDGQLQPKPALNSILEVGENNLVYP